MEQKYMIGIAIGVVVLLLLFLFMSPTPCDTTRIPLCKNGLPAVCRGGKYQCDYYTLSNSSGNIYPSQPKGATIANYANMAEEQAACDADPECAYAYMNTGGQMRYTNYGTSAPGVVTGYRVLPLEANLFKQIPNTDGSSVFFDATSTGQVSNIAKCEEAAVTAGAYGYVYDKKTGTCNSHALYSDISPSGTSKFLKNN